MRKGTGTGTCATAKGYLQITRSGPGRNKLVHRVAMAGMCREWCYWPLEPDGLPAGMEVHHVDFGRQHNCRANLMLLDPALHFHMDRRHRNNRDRDSRGRFGFNAVPPIRALVVYEEFPCAECGTTRRVPVRWYVPDEVPDWVIEENVA